MTRNNPKKRDPSTALGHPMRRRILREMLNSTGDPSPRELAAKLSEPLGALSYHIKVLAECKAVELVRTERTRGATQRFYRPMAKTNWAL